MKTTTCALALSLGLAVASNAALSLTNGDFSSDTSNWNSEFGTSPDGWFSSLASTNTNGNYGEAMTGGGGSNNNFTYGTGRVAALKQVSGNYYQQTIGLVGEQTGVQVDFLGGYRAHSSYSTAARNISIEVSLWDATLNVELASTTIDYAYLAAGNALAAESKVLTYTSANGANDLALRFTNVSANPSGANPNTALIDGVSITAVPEPSSAALLGLGGLALILRRRK
ncbi:MAG: PEP-CTERM sorting domain-containing protein [Akkermansiaceae bacterium]|nr:PEP-CTERM sorting domain-containing protein [Akkermansiaceae bacterium]